MFTSALLKHLKNIVDVISEYFLIAVRETIAGNRRREMYLDAGRGKSHR
jgi:hypothetical protein